VINIYVHERIYMFCKILNIILIWNFKIKTDQIFEILHLFNDAYFVMYVLWKHRLSWFYKVLQKTELKAIPHVIMLL